MLRRAFLKLTGAATVAFAVGVEHFHPAPSVARALEPPQPTLVREETLSPVLQSLRDWNDLRLQSEYAGKQVEIVWSGAGWIALEAVERGDTLIWKA